MADTHCTAQEPLALGALRRFLRPGASDAKSPSGPVRKRKSASTAGFFAGFSLRSGFKVRSAGSATRRARRTLKLVHEGFCKEWEPPDARTPDLLRY